MGAHILSFFRIDSPGRIGRVGETQHMSSSFKDHTLSRREQDAGRDGAGSQPRLSLGLPCPCPTIERKGGRRKGTSDAFSTLGRRCLLTLFPHPELNTKVCSSAPFSHAESQAAPRKKARTSHMQGNLHVWFWPGTPVYCTNMCRSL